MADIQGFLRDYSEEAVAYRYLDLLAERTAQLESMIGLHELQSLQVENQQLRAQVAQLESPPMEQLLVFLPAFFRDFWGHIQPEDLALLTGTLRVPMVSVDMSTPSNATVLAMKRKFLALNHADQSAVLGFCHEIKKSHQLQLHPEVRTLLGDL